MKIGIDARLYGQGLGLGRYVSKLIEHLELHDDTNTYTIFLRKANYDLYTPRNTRFKKVCADVPWYSLKEQWLLPWIFFKERCDLLHVPHFNVPVLYPGALIITIHDVILLKHRLSATSAASTRHPVSHWLKYMGFRVVVRIAIARASRIIVVSQSVAHDLSAFFPSCKRKLRIVREAADAISHSQPLVDPSFDPGKQFFFTAGNAYPHKNISTLLEAVRLASRQIPEIRLILCGQEDFFQKRLIQEINDRGYASIAHHVGCVSDAVLRWLYEHAVAIVLPSLEEGFGLQIVEAFVHSCPVIASRIPPYEEIGGDAVCFVDARKAFEIAGAMQELLRDNERRCAMIQRGTVRAGMFSWNAAAHATVLVYAESIYEAKETIV
ncbi:glycosyltransferase family 4 protein [Candidatus Uhrbacteria bacterium]|nr:glycosyltransferase family 4 protein [Candidatus Uhrbacteria bacterium]